MLLRGERSRGTRGAVAGELGLLLPSQLDLLGHEVASFVDELAKVTITGSEGTAFLVSA